MLLPKINNKKTDINIHMPLAFSKFTDSLNEMLSENLNSSYTSLVFACIGTDRATGDSLGPLIGYKLESMKLKNVYVYGSLESPMHAKNLDSILNQIYHKHENPFIIAIDACLGRFDHIGYITIGEGPLKPGSGVNKELTEVGHIHITGIVNTSGFMEILTLQSTRLSLVMKMADLISTGIRYVAWKHQLEERNSFVNYNIQLSSNKVTKANVAGFQESYL